MQRKNYWNENISSHLHLYSHRDNSQVYTWAAEVPPPTPLPVPCALDVGFLHEYKQSNRGCEHFAGCVFQDVYFFFNNCRLHFFFELYKFCESWKLVFKSYVILFRKYTVSLFLSNIQCETKIRFKCFITYYHTKTEL